MKTALTKKEFNEYLDEMVTHYLHCALWTGYDESNPDDAWGDSLNENYDVDDFAKEAIKLAKKDCKKFLEANANLLINIEAELAGDLFWLTRNGHGEGFGNRDYGKDACSRLKKSAESFGTIHTIIGDSGKIYLEG